MPEKSKISTEKLGLPGVRGRLYAVTDYSNDRSHDQNRLSDELIRPFKVLGQISKGAATTEAINLDFNQESGGSYMALPESAAKLRVQCLDGVFEVKKNKKGEQSLVDFSCNATGSKEAILKFHSVVYPWLDYMSYLGNCPLIVSALKTEDLKNGVISIDYIGPYRRSIINPHEGELHNELLPVYAMYREAKNSHSDFYKFLCFYKILEGLLGVLRANIFSRASVAKVKLVRPKDVVPALSEIPDLYKMHAGQSIKFFFDNVLTPKFRNSVAHFITDDGVILNMSSSEHLRNYGEVLYLLEECVRVVVNSHETLLRSFGGENNNDAS